MNASILSNEMKLDEVLGEVNDIDSDFESVNLEEPQSSLNYPTIMQNN